MLALFLLLAYCLRRLRIQMHELSLVVLDAMKAIRMLEAFNLKRPQTLSAAVPASTTVDLFSNICYTEAALLILSITLFVVLTQNLRCMLSRLRNTAVSSIWNRFTIQDRSYFYSNGRRSRRCLGRR